jgi:hypothetical protein
MYCLYISLFFNVVAGIYEVLAPASVSPSHRSLLPAFEPCHDCDCHAVSIALIQECGDKPKFHLQSQWNPETHLLPVCSMRETSA